jgi:hypothetical protein
LDQNRRLGLKDFVSDSRASLFIYLQQNTKKKNFSSSLPIDGNGGDESLLFTPTADASSDYVI